MILTLLISLFSTVNSFPLMNNKIEIINANKILTQEEYLGCTFVIVNNNETENDIKLKVNKLIPQMLFKLDFEWLKNENPLIGQKLKNMIKL